MWLPEKYRERNTSEYVQGVEVTMDHTGIIPDGFDVITLPAAKYLMFQGIPQLLFMVYQEIFCRYLT